MREEGGKSMYLVREKGGGCLVREEGRRGLVREGEEGVWCRREEEGVSVERGKGTPLFTCGEGGVATDSICTLYYIVHVSMGWKTITTTWRGFPYSMP